MKYLSGLVINLFRYFQISQCELSIRSDFLIRALLLETQLFVNDFTGSTEQERRHQRSVNKSSLHNPFVHGLV